MVDLVNASIPVVSIGEQVHANDIEECVPFTLLCIGQINGGYRETRVYWRHNDTRDAHVFDETQLHGSSNYWHTAKECHRERHE